MWSIIFLNVDVWKSSCSLHREQTSVKSELKLISTATEHKITKLTPFITYGLAEGQRIILVRQLGVRRCHFYCFQSNLIALLEIGRCNSWDIEPRSSDVRAKNCQNCWQEDEFGLLYHLHCQPFSNTTEWRKSTSLYKKINL